MVSLFPFLIELGKFVPYANITWFLLGFQLSIDMLLSL